MTKKGFTLIELMIVVVIIGILAALAIPRFLAASKKAKISEARTMLKQIYTAAETYYQENGGFPPLHTFNDASTKNNDWLSYPGLIVDRPSGYPRFSYGTSIGSGGANFGAEAYAGDSWDASLHDVPILYINSVGQITGGE